jgi:hypothetical protein
VPIEPGVVRAVLSPDVEHTSTAVEKLVLKLPAQKSREIDKRFGWGYLTPK